MKYLKYFLLLIVVFLSSCKDAGNSDAAASSKQILLNLVNDYRTTGCQCGSDMMPPVDPVEWNDMLELAAKSHSEDMDENNFLSHTGSDGSSHADRATSFGYPSIYGGENIVRGDYTEEEAVEHWMSSESHCKNVMNSNFEDMGIAKSGIYWTQVFGFIW